MITFRIKNVHVFTLANKEKQYLQVESDCVSALPVE